MTPADLPDHVLPATLAVARGEVERGIFVDGVGYGSAMIANKVAGVFAAVCQDPFCAGLARSHSDTNVLCLGGKIIGSAIALEIVRVWMATDWLGATEGGEKYAPPGPEGQGHRRPAPRAAGLNAGHARRTCRGLRRYVWCSSAASVPGPTHLDRRAELRKPLCQKRIRTAYVGSAARVNRSMTSIAVGSTRTV